MLKSVYPWCLHRCCATLFCFLSHISLFHSADSNIQQRSGKTFQALSQCQPTCRRNKAWNQAEATRGGFKNLKPTGSSCYRGGSRSRGDTDTGLIKATGSVRVVDVRHGQHLSGRVDGGAALAGWYQFHHRTNTLRLPAVCLTWTQRYDCSICTSATTQTTNNTWWMISSWLCAV